FPRPLLQDLIARGHKFQKIGRKGEVRYGYASAILVDVANHRVEGGAEPRRAHAAVPFSAAATTQHYPLSSLTLMIEAIRRIVTVRLRFASFERCGAVGAIHPS